MHDTPGVSFPWFHLKEIKNIEVYIYQKPDPRPAPYKVLDASSCNDPTLGINSFNLCIFCNS